MMSVRFFAAAAVVLFVVIALKGQPVEAVDEKPASSKTSGVRVIELFTSEGCSSCPPADRLLSELAKRDDVIALSFHVDYWNRLGWRDPFSINESTTRQYWYANLFSSSQVYTPQAVVGGQQEVVGSRRSEITAALTNVSPATRPIDVEVSARGRSRDVVIRTQAASVNVALVQPYATMDVPRGENGGRTLSHTNVVRDFVVVKTRNGTATATLQVPSDVTDSLVVVYSQSQTGVIEGATIKK